MTLIEAHERARIESQNGYVQHVNIVTINVDGVQAIDGSKMLDYTVSDWYDGGFTVASYENGREL